MLLALSPNATRNMLKIFDLFGERHSVIFNAISQNIYYVHLQIDLMMHGGNIFPVISYFSRNFQNIIVDNNNNNAS